MSKPRHSNWAWLLLLGTAVMVFLGSLSRLATGDGGYPGYLPAIFSGLYRGYLPVIADKPLPSYPYILQPGSPTYLANFINTSGCNWFGVVGRVFGPDGNPVLDLIVHLEGGGLSVDALTGSGPPALGPGSYVIVLGDHPRATTGVYFIQLRNTAGTPLSDIYSIPTYADCSKNLVMVNFVARQSVPPTIVPPPTPAGTPYPGLPER